MDVKLLGESCGEQNVYRLPKYHLQKPLKRIFLNSIFNILSQWEIWCSPPPVTRLNMTSNEHSVPPKVIEYEVYNFSNEMFLPRIFDLDRIRPQS